MENMIMLAKMIVVLLLGVAIGNWFFTKVKQGKAAGAPWYKAYLSLPGIIIILALFGLPVVLWLTNP